MEIHHDKANRASAGVPRKLGLEWLAEFEDEPAAPADTGIEWRWRMAKDDWDERSWRPRPVAGTAAPAEDPRPDPRPDPRHETAALTRGYGSGCDPRFWTVTVPELSGWALPGA